MNGRLYDPLMGRMFSPDPYIMGADNTQGYNRYTYALNNPLSYTDPSGDIVWFVPVIIGAVVGAYTGASMQSHSFNPANWTSNSWKGAIVGGIIGAAGGAMFSAAIGATGIMNAAGATTQAWGITTSALQGGVVNMGFSAVSGSGELWKAGLTGMASGAWTATGGLGLVKTGFSGRLGYQIIGTAGRSIGNNWVNGQPAFSKVMVGVGPVNLTFGKGQRLFQWQNNIGNIAMNAFGLANLAFGGKASFDWSNLTSVYKGGIIDKIYNPYEGWESGFSPYTITGNSNLNSLISHEMHHVWQSRSMGDMFMPNYILQGINSWLYGNGFVEAPNWYESISPSVNNEINNWW